jgi:hypothetical protein
MKHSIYEKFEKNWELFLRDLPNEIYAGFLPMKCANLNIHSSSKRFDTSTSTGGYLEYAYVDLRSNNGHKIELEIALTGAPVESPKEIILHSIPDAIIQGSNMVLAVVYSCACTMFRSPYVDSIQITTYEKHSEVNQVTAIILDRN